MIPNQREYEIFGMGQTRIYVCCYVNIVSFVQYLLSSLNTNSAKTPFEVLAHRPAQTERGLQWFKMSFWLPDNSTANSRLALYQTRRNEVVGQEQYQTIHQNSASLLHKY